MMTLRVPRQFRLCSHLYIVSDTLVVYRGFRGKSYLSSTFWWPPGSPLNIILCSHFYIVSNSLVVWSDGYCYHYADLKISISLRNTVVVTVFNLFYTVLFMIIYTDFGYQIWIPFYLFWCLMLFVPSPASCKSWHFLSFVSWVVIFSFIWVSSTVGSFLFL